MLTIMIQMSILIGMLLIGFLGGFICGIKKRNKVMSELFRPKQ